MNAETMQQAAQRCERFPSTIQILQTHHGVQVMSGECWYGIDANQNDVARSAINEIAKCHQRRYADRPYYSPGKRPKR